MQTVLFFLFVFEEKVTEINNSVSVGLVSKSKKKTGNNLNFFLTAKYEYTIIKTREKI